MSGESRNDLLELKDDFIPRGNPSSPGFPTLPGRRAVLTSHLMDLENEIDDLIEFWKKQSLIKGALVSVDYNAVVAKSHRIDSFFKQGSEHTNQFIVGARFSSEGTLRHIITYYVKKDALYETKVHLHSAILLCDFLFPDGEITQDKIDGINLTPSLLLRYGLSKTLFLRLVVDSFYVGQFFLPQSSELPSGDQLVVTLYRTEAKAADCLRRLGIAFEDSDVIDDTSILLKRNECEKLSKGAGYLIAMGVNDFTQFVTEDLAESSAEPPYNIPEPNGEPAIGVIDTLFDERCPFHRWVEYHDWVNPDIGRVSEDYEHGTVVTSLIVDGPAFNKDLEDDCGRFRVKHFGVATKAATSSFSIIKKIKEAVEENPEIKVWNLCLGSDREVSPDFISLEGAALDRIQHDKKIVFIIAGTNSRKGEPNKRVGAPADSINALVVNSVDENNRPASYSREGPVLSFFTKPDVCAFGGDVRKRVCVCGSTGQAWVSGTSFAAPWITRKMAYLVYKMGLSIEVAKALLIDSAVSWKEGYPTDHVAFLKGFGVVPKKIEDIIESPKDEIKFYVMGVSTKWESYNHNLPVPAVNNKFPYIAKATLCYMSSCSRNQGVDYTDTELDLHFGRVKADQIVSINGNKQSESGSYTREPSARRLYRKWDNVKHINQILKEGLRDKDAYERPLWGFSVKRTERLDQESREDVPFGIVVTLKEIHGVNRYDEFIHSCSLRGWLINRVNIENRLHIYADAEEQIVFEKPKGK